MTTKLINKIKEINEQKYAYKSQGSKLQLSKWIHLDRLMIIDNYFDGMPLQSITKLKVKGERGEGKTYILKLTMNEVDFFYSFKKDVQLQWFKHIIWGKLYSLINLNPINQEYKNLCEGYIFKKSNIQKVWNKRFVSITKFGGLISCKQKMDAPSHEIDSIKQLWTRFELIQKKGFLVFKMHHSFSKYEFAVPVELVLKWAHAFYSLLKFQQ